MKKGSKLTEKLFVHSSFTVEELDLMKKGSKRNQLREVGEGKLVEELDLMKKGSKHTSEQVSVTNRIKLKNST